MNIEYERYLSGKRHKKTVLMATLVAMLHFFICCFSAGVNYVVILSYPFLGYMLLPFTVLLIGTRFRAINNMSHECIHRTYCENSRLNEIFGELFAILEFSRFRTTRREHMTHHKYLGDFSRDLDFKHLRCYGFQRQLSRKIILEHICCALTLRHLSKYLFFYVYDKYAPYWSNAIRVMYLLTLTALMIEFPVMITLFLIVPYLTSYQIHKYFIDVLDHGGLLQNPEEIDKSRNFIVNNALLKYLFFPRNDCYHLIHHLFPTMPVEYFSDSHKQLIKNKRYSEKHHQSYQQLQDWFTKE